MSEELKPSNKNEQPRDLPEEEVKMPEPKVEDVENQQKEAEGNSEDLLKVEQIKDQMEEQGLQEAVKTIQDTNQMEALLEKEQVSQQSPKKSWWKRTWGKLAIGATVLIGGGIATNEGIKHYQDYKEGQTIEKNVGFDLRGIAEKHDLTAKLQVDNGTGQYILHIGQSHVDVSSEARTAKYQDKIIDTQKKMEQFVVDMQRAGKMGNTFYIEGANAQEAATFYQKIAEKLKNQKITASEYAEVMDSLSDSNKTLKEEKDFSKKVVYYPLFYAYLNKAEEMEHNFSIELPKFDIELEKRICKLRDQGKIEQGILTESESFRKARETFQKIKKQDDFQQKKEGIYLSGNGMVNKMIMDGKVINTIPVDSEELHNKATELLRKLGGFEGVFKRIEGTLSPELEIVYLQWKHVIMREREEHVMEVMQSHMRGRGNKIMPLIYGRAHNFAGVVEEYNKRNPDNRSGLIKVSN